VRPPTALAACLWIAGCSATTTTSSDAPEGTAAPARLDLQLSDRQLSLTSAVGFECNPRTGKLDAAFELDDGVGALRFRLTPAQDGTYRATSTFDASIGYVLRDADFAISLDPSTRQTALEFTGLVEKEPTAMHTGVGCRSMKGVEISPVRGRIAAVLPTCPQRA